MGNKCAICETTFESNNPLKRYCSKPCAVVAKKQKEQAKIGKAVCVVCSQEFQPKGKPKPEQGKFNKYCSVKCRCSDPEWKKADRKVKKYLTAGTGIAPFSVVAFNTCKSCAKLFTTRNISIPTCSVNCRENYITNRKEEYAALALLKEKRNYKPKTLNCKQCDKLFTTTYGDKRQGFCTNECSTRYNKKAARRKYGSKHRERAKYFGCYYEPVNVLKVFARDKWTCQICGIKTPQRLKGTTEPNAPELDHIIPLSKQGPHSYGNVQCACKKCNGLKSDKIEGQLPLFINNITHSIGGRQTTYRITQHEPQPSLFHTRATAKPFL